jgi:hypothetical protein
MFSSRTWAIVPFAVLAHFASLTAQERFDLTVPGTDVRSVAELGQRTLTIAEGEARSFVYTRTPALDSPDGKYVGFLNGQLRKAIRWPARGEGAFQIGTVSPAGRVTYRESQMRIRRTAPRGEPRRVNKASIGPTNIATAVGRNGTLQAAYIDQVGQLQFAIQEREQWRLVSGKANEPLVPGAPLALLPDSRSEVPEVYTIGRDGRLTMIRSGRVSSRSNAALYNPGSHLTVVDEGVRATLLAVAADGRLVVDALDTPDLDGYVERQPRQLIPGSPVAMLGDEEVYVIDAGGAIRGYGRNLGGWFRKDPHLGRGRPINGFPPGGSLSAVHVHSTPVARASYLFAVDSLGGLQTIRESAPGRWECGQIGNDIFPPGLPISASYTSGRLQVSATLADGNWYEWHTHGLAGPWTKTLISRGFARHSPTHFSHSGHPHCFAIDRRGVLVAAHVDARSVWHPTLVAPGFAAAPLLVSREVAPNPPLRPVEVMLTNEHTRELWLLIADLRNPRKPTRMKLKPGESKPVVLERDAGSQLVETIETLGRAERHVYDLPPQPLYDISVYELFLQSVAIDRTKRGKGKVEDINWSPKSIGILPVPPGELLRDGTTLDVFAEAKSERNAGAVRRLDMEQWKVDNTVPPGLRVP